VAEFQLARHRLAEQGKFKFSHLPNPSRQLTHLILGAYHFRLA